MAAKKKAANARAAGKKLQTPPKRASSKKPWGDAAAVQKYLKELPSAQRAPLVELRQWIVEVAPDAVEGISYSMPAFKLHGATVGFAAFTRHLTFFPFSGSFLSAYADELAGFSRAPSGVHFTPERRLPKELLQRMVRDRLKV